MDDITLVMNLYWIDSLLTATLELKPSALISGTKQASKILSLLLPQYVSDLHLP
jgi:hypothetical protein